MPPSPPPPFRRRSHAGLHARSSERRHPDLGTQRHALGQVGHLRPYERRLELERLDRQVGLGQHAGGRRAERKAAAELADIKSEHATGCAERRAVDEGADGSARYDLNSVFCRTPRIARYL